MTNEKSFHDKVVVITGGARGQGRSHALTLAARGASVAICDVPDEMSTVPYPLATKKDLEEARERVLDQGVDCLAAAVDVRDTDAVQHFGEQVWEQFGRVDHVVANAGILGVPSLRATSWEISPAQWSEVIDVNLNGVWNTCRTFVPYQLRGEGNRSITMTSSTAGLSGLEQLGHYAASKHAIVGLMRCLALELGPQGVRVNTIHPTGVDTAMVVNESVAAWLAQHTDVNRSQQNVMPVERIGVEDVSNAVAWLMSDEARYVTGVTLPIDAGFLL